MKPLPKDKSVLVEINHSHGIEKDLVPAAWSPDHDAFVDYRTGLTVHGRITGWVWPEDDHKVSRQAIARHSRSTAYAASLHLSAI